MKTSNWLASWQASAWTVRSSRARSETTAEPCGKRKLTDDAQQNYALSGRRAYRDLDPARSVKGYESACREPPQIR